MTDADLLELFAMAADAVNTAVGKLTAEERLAPGERPGQYALDLAADAAVLDVLHRAPVGVVSEESAASGDASSGVTVVVDPVDGSTNCSRGIPYWSTSLAAVDAEGLVAATVAHQVTGARFTALRGEGAWRDGAPITPSRVDDPGEAIVGLSGPPPRFPRAAQFRALGSVALELCEVASGALDGLLDGAGEQAPWDYLAGTLICREAGAIVVEAHDRELVTIDHEARRQPVAASTRAVLDELLGAVR